jgi:hypothetical protein
MHTPYWGCALAFAHMMGYNAKKEAVLYPGTFQPAPKGIRAGLINQSFERIPYVREKL